MKRHWIFTVTALIVVTAGLSFWGCSKDNPTAATTGCITGVVSDSSTSTAISGATVVTSPVTSSVITNTYGQYTINGVNAGNYTVTASKTSYNSKSVSIAVTASNTAIANIALSPGVPGNNAPNTPTNPSPADAAASTSTAPTLSWTCTDPDVGDTLKYDVYFGTENPPVSIVSSNQATTSLSRSGLTNSTTYYWKIIAKDNHGASTSSPVWSFATASSGTPIEWISIPEGNFKMGSLPTDPNIQSEELPQHSVYLDAYQISKYEITNAQYKTFMDAGGYSNSAYWTTEGWSWKDANGITEPYYWSTGAYNSGTAFPDHPVVGVSWYEAYAFCQWVGGHLPTEAQWEKAARGTDSSNYWPWGSSWNGAYCNTSHQVPPDTFFYSSPVGYFSNGQSPYGLYDMAGNVHEWVNDWYQSDYYSVSPASNPTGPASGTYRVGRGSSFEEIDEYFCRTAYRNNGAQPYSRSSILGFRPAK